MQKRFKIIGLALVTCFLVGAAMASAAQPLKGGNLVFGSVTEVASLDPHVYQGTAWKTINLCLYNSLLGFDEKGPSRELGNTGRQNHCFSSSQGP